MKESSVRFNPHWEKDTGCQVHGLINLVFDIYNDNPDASTWVEIGTFFGESTLIISSFRRVDFLSFKEILFSLFEFRPR